MKKFLLKLSIGIILLLLIPLVIIILPPTKAYKKSLFYSLIDKNNLLKNTASPRIIFIGGSNLSFGLNSERIRDSLHMNPINTGIHASLGLKYMLANSVKYIKENDIIVVSPEYHEFYNGYANGEIELLSIIIEVAPKSIGLLNYKQYFKLIKYFPEFINSKFETYKNGNIVDTTTGIYDRKSFNYYGDVYKHWNLPKGNVKPLPSIIGKFDNDALQSLINFREIIKDKKTKLYIAFPCYQKSSFTNSIDQINEIEQKLKKNGFNLLSDPERYIMPDSLIFNHPYHSIKKGVDLRTSLLIEDLKKALKK